MDDNQISQQPYLTFFDENTAEYDVIVDQSSSAPNLKEATWAAIQPLLPIVGDRIGPEEMSLILEYSPMPESFLEQFKALQDKKAQQPPPPDPEMKKIEAMQQAKQAELQLRQQETGVSIQMEQQKTAAQLDLERQKAAAAAQLEREKAEAQLMLERERNAMNLQMERERMAFDKERLQHDMVLKSRSAKADMAIKAGMARINMENDGSEAEDGAQSPDMEEMDLFGNKALADALTQMAQSISVMAQANAESQRMMADGVAQLGAELRDAMTKPKTIVRGPDGRAIGVQ